MKIVPYCLNIHPGESLQEVNIAIDTEAARVKAALAPDSPYPLGLRLSAQAAAELDTPEALERFSARLHEQGFYCNCINGFPYGAFHNTTVKETVYAPDWGTPERLHYTARLARILAALPDAGSGTGSISTLPLGYSTCAPGERHPRMRLFARQLALMAEFLADQEAHSGRTITLALEPEPDCLLEGIDDTIAWYEDELLYEGMRWLSSGGRRTRTAAEALLRRYIAICLDTCHFALGFEEPLSALIRFESACIAVARIQISNALSTTFTPQSTAELRPFFDPVYMHQTRIKLPQGRLLKLPDLNAENLRNASAHHGCELRTHFHLPLFFTGAGALGSTAHTLTKPFFAHLLAKGYPLEIETYTYNVLPPALRSRTLTEHLIAEHRWLQQRLSDSKAEVPHEPAT